MSQGIVSASVVAGPLEVTGHRSLEAGQQLRMGTNLFIHIHPDTAQQWIETLSTIAKENEA